MTVQACCATTRGPAFVLALALAGAVSSGCDASASRQLAGPSAAVTATVAKVTVTPTSASVAAAASTTLVATAFDASGQPISGLTFGWSSTVKTVATVAGGVVTGVAPGSATIKVSTGGYTAMAAITVITPQAASVLVAPDTASLQVGQAARLAVAVLGPDGLPLARPVTWASSSPAVAAVDSTGLVTGALLGSAQIVATADGKADTATVSVTPELAVAVVLTPTSATVPVAGTERMVATALGATGNVLTRPLTWTSSAPGVATVGAGGLVTGVAAGSADVTVTVDGKSATSQITVPAPAPPPPPPPPTAGALFTDAFEAGYAAKQNGAGWTNTAPVNITVSTDVAHSGSHSLRFSFPGKADCNDASAQQNFTLGRNMTEVWVEYYSYFPKGGEGGSATYYHRSQAGCSNSADNNKFFVLYGPKYAGETTLGLQSWTTKLQAGAERLNTAYSKAGRNGVWFYGANDDPFVTSADLGQWIQIRVHARLATFGQCDGVVEVWRNGVKILSNTALDWYDSTNAANYMTQGYLMGWSDSGFAQTTNIYLDDFSIIDQNPGW